MPAELSSLLRNEWFTLRLIGWSVRWSFALSGVLLACAMSSFVGCNGVEADVLLLKQTHEMDPTLSMPGDDAPNFPPLPLPPPRRCMLREQGDGRSCQTADAWKWSAQTDCATQPGGVTEPTTGAGSLHLEGLELTGPCGRGVALYFGVRYICCPDPNAVVIERPNGSSSGLNVATEPAEQIETKRRPS